MNLAAFNSYCSQLPATTKVIQWGGAHVWKVGGKVFSIASHWGKDTSVEIFKISFKCSEFSFQILTEQPDIKPAPYLGRYQWVQLEQPDALTDVEAENYITEAHKIIVAKLTRAKRLELGI